MTYLVNHTADSRRVLMNYSVVQTMQPQGFNYSPLVLGPTYCAFNPGYLYFRHNQSTICPVREFGLHSPLGVSVSASATGTVITSCTSEGIGRPNLRANSISGSFNWRKASIVA